MFNLVSQPTLFVLYDLIKMEYFLDAKFQGIGTARIQLDGRRRKRSTPRTRM